MAYTQQALLLDPLRPVELTYLGQYLRDLGRRSEARETLRRALDLDPHDVIMAHEILGEIDLIEGDPKAALSEMQREPPSYLRELGLSMTYYAMGQKKESDDALAHIVAQYPGIASYQIAQVYAYRGEADHAFLWLDRAYELHDPGLPWFKSDLKMKKLRSDPRYGEFLRRLHLD